MIAATVRLPWVAPIFYTCVYLMCWVRAIWEMIAVGTAHHDMFMVAERGGQKGESTDVDSLDGRSALRSTAGTHDAGAAGQSAPHMTITWYGQGRPMMPCGLEDTLRFLERVTAVLAVAQWSEATARPFRMARRQGRCVRSQQVPDVGGTHTGEGQSCFPDQMW